MNVKDKTKILLNRCTPPSGRYVIDQQFGFSIYVWALRAAFVSFSRTCFPACLQNFNLQELGGASFSADYSSETAHTGYDNLLFRLNPF